MSELFPNAKPRKPRRMRPRDPLWDWVEVRFFDGTVASRQQANCGDAVKLFAEKGLNIVELEKRCKRHVDLWPGCTLTLRSLMTHIDDLAKPTVEERKRQQKAKAAELKRLRWFQDRNDARALATEAVKRCKTRNHRPASQPQTCADCTNLVRWSKEYGWSYK